MVRRRGEGARARDCCMGRRTTLHYSTTRPRSSRIRPRDADLGHVAFFDDRPAEFERRVVGFFDRYLLTSVQQPASTNSG